MRARLTSRKIFIHPLDVLGSSGYIENTMATATEPTTSRHPALSIQCSRKRYYIHAGKSRLSRGFKSEGEAQEHLTANLGFYTYWQGSASVSFENTTPTTIRLSAP